MDERVKPFSYRLAAVLKKDRWEGQALGAEASRARVLVEEARRRHREALDDIAQTERELRELCQSEQLIPLERRRILDLFLRHQHAVAAVRQQDSAKAETLYGQVMSQLESKHKAIKALENHQDRQRHAHDVQQTRQSLKASDDLWLLGRRRSSPHGGSR